jgi:predicted phage-related endonuclease
MSKFLPEWAAENCEPISNDGTKAGWLASRRSGISGTDITRVCNMSKWGNAFDVYLDKRGEAPEIDCGDAAMIGNYLEPGIRQWLSDQDKCLIYESPGALQSKSFALMVGTPDGLYEGFPRIAEIKTFGTCNGWATLKLDPDDWGDINTDIVPTDYFFQVQWYMELTGADECHLAAFISGHGFRRYTITRDRDLVNWMMETAAKFWRDNVQADTPPDIEGSRLAPAWVSQKYPQNVRSEIIDATQDVEQWAAELAIIKNTLKSAESRKEALETMIKNQIQDADGIKGAFGKATWKQQKGRTSTDWKAIVNEVGIEEEIIGKYTRAGSPFRVFRFSPAK